MESDSSRTPSNGHQFKKVLIAIDNNPSAREVVKSGYLYSKAIGAEIILIQVISKLKPYTLPEYSPVIKFISYDHAVSEKHISNSFLKKETQLFLDKTKLMIGDNNIQTIVAEGDYTDEILYAAESLKADLIIVGPQHKGILNKIFFGDVIQKLLNQSSIPILLVPPCRTNS